MISRFELFFLKRLISHSCPNSTPQSGETSERVDCYDVYLKNGADQYLLYVNDISSEGFLGTHVNDQNMLDCQACVPFSCMHDVSIEIVRFISCWKFTYQSVVKCILHDWTYLNRFPIIRDVVDQFFFNRRDLALKERIKVLKLLAEKFFENSTSASTFCEIDLVIWLHGRRWHRHPDSKRLRSQARLILESLEKSGELQRVEDEKFFFNFYSLTGNALTTLETYEREAIRHEQMISQSRHMKWLTFALIVVGIIQAAVAYFK